MELVLLWMLSPLLGSGVQLWQWWLFKGLVSLRVSVETGCSCSAEPQNGFVCLLCSCAGLLPLATTGLWRWEQFWRKTSLSGPASKDGTRVLATPGCLRTGVCPESCIRGGQVSFSAHTGGGSWLSVLLRKKYRLGPLERYV